MTENNERSLKDAFYEYLHIYAIVIFTGITVVLIVFRILLYFFEFPPLVEEAKDYDYILLIKGMDNGLVNFYDPVPGYEWPPYYLYFWYFIFYPMYLMPIHVGVYVWDIIRLVVVIYIIKEAQKVFKSKFDLLLFYVVSGIAFSLDTYYGNCNFIPAFFLFQSYCSLENNKKWRSGIFFTLATFKINSIIFLPVLLLIKKIKIKDLRYYLIPFFLICLPYIIFPDYFMQMLGNWLHSDEFVQGYTPFDSIFWKALQPSHLMTISFFFLCFTENLQNPKRKKQFKTIVLPLLLIYYAYLTMIVFVVPVFFMGYRGF